MEGERERERERRGEERFSSKKIREFKKNHSQGMIPTSWQERDTGDREGRSLRESEGREASASVRVNFCANGLGQLLH
jgi:hypothetical protein